MRCLLSALAVCGIVLAVSGCHHTAGVCDCDTGTNPCLYPSALSAPRSYTTPYPLAAPASPEPIKVMPKAEAPKVEEK